ncbi:MAG: hypothetical protein ABF608_00665 [Sporolactobacillus sp.]
MPNSYFSIYLIAIIGLILYRRIRRNIGWQPLRSRKMESRLVICSIISLLLLYGNLRYPIGLASDVLGIVLGLVLGFIGMLYTTLKTVNGETLYRPNTWIGSVVTLLFLFRFGFRIIAMLQIGSDMNGSEKGTNALQTLGGNSWTAGLMLILFAYYIAYYGLLIRRQHLPLTEA